MKNIIVPVDFSTKTYNALALAKSIAKNTHATIHLIHVIEPIPGNYSWLVDLDEDVPDDAFVVSLVERLNKEMSTLKNLEGSSSFKITSEIIVGDPFKILKHKMETLGADLVIIGAKTVVDAEEVILGSISNKIIRSVTCPVITVKDAIETYKFDNIIYATDMQEDHEDLVRLLQKWQRLFGSTIHIVRINTRKDFKNDIDTKVDLLKLAHKHNLKDYTTNSYSHEDEEYGIVYFADEIKADLIAMGIHEKSGLERLITGGSLASEVTDHTFRPILTYAFKDS